MDEASEAQPHGSEGSAGRLSPGGIHAVAGARRVEAVLVAAVERALDAAPDDASQWSRPVRVVVPSTSLRVHVASCIARARGRAAVGLSIQTLGALALEILERSGAVVHDPLLFPLWVRRAARREPALAEGLEDRVDGYGAVVAAVHDLLDAGLQPPHADAIEEHLVAQPAGRDRTARARAVVRVAARVASQLERDGVGHRSQLLIHAREALEQTPALLPHRALLLHGFADATGVQADLLAALVRVAGATLLLDAATDPTSGGDRRAGPRFGLAFRERFMDARDAAVHDGAGASVPCVSPAKIALLAAPSPAAEVRAVALRLRERLDAGVAPERLAVVARDLAPYRTLLRTQLLRIGVPFSGVAERGAATAARRRLDALLAVIAPDVLPSMETWLTAREGMSGFDRAALRRRCHRRGALRLDDVAELSDAPRDARLARTLADALASRPRDASLAQHAAWLEALASGPLGWHSDSPGGADLDAALRALPDARVDPHEFASLVADRLSGAGWAPLGGRGGGVQVLSVMEARARSFEHLFVLGLQRGAFPRSIREDPLLPDAVRSRLREVLPDLPVKRDGFDEERFLFAQLLSAADTVTLCWSDTNAEGRPQPRSPLLESLVRAHGSIAHERAEPLHAPAPRAVSLAESERALLAGLAAPRAVFAPVFARALEAASVDIASPAARLAVLDELDPRDARRSALGPYFGFVGRVASPDDPRSDPLFVTRLEAVARCPWQAFLTRVLRLEPIPDAAGDLPAADDARLLGNVVHRALERVVHRPLEEGETLATREAVPVPWPEDSTLERWLEEAAEHELREHAVGVPGYARVLARRARPYVERARACDWSEGPPAVVATELSASATVRDVGGRERIVHFRADRVDRVRGRLVFTDYKTGKPIAAQKSPAQRDQALCQEIARGRALQALLYARAGGEGASARYLFLSPNAPDAGRVLRVADASPWSDAFASALPPLLEAWDSGAFLPRLRRPDRDEEPGACRSCEVRDACLRGDSGARARLERWDASDGARPDDALRAASAVFRLGMDA